MGMVLTRRCSRSAVGRVPTRLRCGRRLRYAAPAPRVMLCLSPGSLMAEDRQSILSALDRIDDLEDSIRNFINIGRHQSELLDARDIWNQICSSLDVIGDTTLSVKEYICAPYPKSDGLKYIFTYGILQSLFLQQDAVRHLTEAFKLPHTVSENLTKIRGIRNASIGHPSKQQVKKQTFYNYISRITLAKSGFTLMQEPVGCDTRFIQINLISIIVEQLSEIEIALSSISGKLQEVDRVHREKFGGARLTDIFHASSGYLFEKVAQGIHSPSYGNSSFGLAMLGAIEEMYGKFETALSDRRELNDYTRYDLKEYKHAIGVLKGYLSGNSQLLSESDASIYHFYLREQHKHFVKIAEEVDIEYKET